MSIPQYKIIFEDDGLCVYRKDEDIDEYSPVSVFLYLGYTMNAKRELKRFLSGINRDLANFEKRRETRKHCSRKPSSV